MRTGKIALSFQKENMADSADSRLANLVLTHSRILK